MITELTDEIRKEINKIFFDYKTHLDNEKLLEELEPYKYPDGSFSMYIRQSFDELL